MSIVNKGELKNSCKEILSPLHILITVSIVKFVLGLEFTIYEPKERKIKTLNYKDRVVICWYVENFLKPYFKPNFIEDSYACLEGKGTHKAVKK